MGQALYPKVRAWFNSLTEAQQAQLKSAPNPKKIAQRILRMEVNGRFEMHDWFTPERDRPELCGSAMCMAGWAMNSAGLTTDPSLDPDRLFTFEDGRGVINELAGAFLLSLNEEEVNIFYSDNDSALRFIKDRWDL